MKLYNGFWSVDRCGYFSSFSSLPSGFIPYKRRSNIYYTGIGAKKDGLHTEEEFLDIAKRYFKECESSTCFKNKSCKLRKKLAKKMQDTNMNVYLNAIDECNKCIKTHKCTTSKEYMKHSGAVVRKS